MSKTWTTSIVTYHDSRIVKYQKEGQCKGNDQQKRKSQNLEEGAADGGKHEHIDSSQWEIREKDQQVNPRQEDSHNSKLPLPLIRTEATVLKHPHKDEWETIETYLHPVDQTDEIAPLHCRNLIGLQHKTKYDTHNNYSSSEVQTNSGSWTQSLYSA